MGTEMRHRYGGQPRTETHNQSDHGFACRTRSCGVGVRRGLVWFIVAVIPRNTSDLGLHIVDSKYRVHDVLDT